ncbi:MAG: ABC transporter ATP-binding protein [Bacteroidales bacterium]|nr:ABC transporter ATP-binding protein [Bacteroidales bacterium]
MKNLLDVENLKVTFTSDGMKVCAVDDISFSLGQSEILGIVGESGSGKSVTALSILGLIPQPPGFVSAKAISFKDPYQGEIRLDTLSEKELQAVRGRSISMIFQEPMTSLNPVYTCGNQVLEAIRQHLDISRKEAKRTVLQLFEEVRLPDPPGIYRAYPHQLSGGQKQRVMIAMAISCDPAILIADEPTTALDVSVQKTILDLLKTLLQKRQMSILFITHDLGLISGFANRVLVMYQGKIVERGAIKTVFQHPKHPYTRGLIACRPQADIRLRTLPTVENFLQKANEEQNKNCHCEEPKPRVQRRGSDEANRKNTISAKERNAIHEKLYRNDPVLRVEGVVKVFSGRGGMFSQNKADYVAVNNISFGIYQGETLGIVGESGCGKTTLARTVLQLIPPSEGKVFYQDQDITRLTYRKRKALYKDLQIVFQDPYSSLNPRMTIGAAILEPMKVHHLLNNDRQRKVKVEKLLEKVGLTPDHFYRYPHEFSGGQRQRICIARALAVEPQLIICDESVSALDVSIQAQILNLLNDLKRDFHLTYIFISHDLNVVKYMSDRLIVMKEGRIVEIGDPDEIYKDPKSEYTKILLDAMND